MQVDYSIYFALGYASFKSFNDSLWHLLCLSFIDFVQQPAPCFRPSQALLSDYFWPGAWQYPRSVNDRLQILIR